MAHLKKMSDIGVADYLKENSHNFESQWHKIISISKNWV